MKMNLFKSLAILGGALLPLTPSVAEAASLAVNVIDSFVVPQTARDSTVNPGTSGPGNDSTTTVPDIGDTFIGETRQFQVQVTQRATGTASSNALELISDPTADGQLNLNGDTGILGTATVSYGFGGETFDLTNGGLNDAILVFLDSNNIPNDLSFTLASGGTSVTATQELPLLATNVSVLYPFSQFPGIDFANISALSYQFGLQFNQGTDTRISFIEVVDTNPSQDVPEPTALAGLGLMALAFQRSRRQAIEK